MLTFWDIYFIASFIYLHGDLEDACLFTAAIEFRF